MVQHIRVIIDISMVILSSSVPGISGTATLDYPRTIVGVRDVLCSASFFLRSTLVLIFTVPVVIVIAQIRVCLFHRERLVVPKIQARRLLLETQHE